MSNTKKDDLPAMPFYWGDWFKAPDIQSLPRETRCVWFEMLGRMWEGNERGFLSINGKAMTDFALASLLGFGADVHSYKKHEARLEESGIFSRRESDGAIYSRFMLKYIEISKKRKDAGSKGGSKTQARGQANVEYENEDENVFAGGRAFEIIWEKYPDKTGKKEALRHFLASVKTQEDFLSIEIALENYLKSQRVIKGYVQNGATWFNNWKDWVNPSEITMQKGQSFGTSQKSNAGHGAGGSTTESNLRRSTAIAENIIKLREEQSKS